MGDRRGRGVAALVARLPEGDVGGAGPVLLVKLDEAATQPVGAEGRRADLEVDVLLAALFSGRAPAGADFEGIGP